MTLPEESTVPSPTMDHSSPDPLVASMYDESDSHHLWDINDSNLPVITEHEPYEDWPLGHCKFVYTEASEDARRHSSGWAMRNTNNHNVNILKKSCLGVLVCSQRCTPESGERVHMRPAICDKARKKQLGKTCPNPRCNGRLELLACRGHCGYPVTHFWRHVNGFVFFQAKGSHDHDQPELKSSAEARRHQYGSRDGDKSTHTVEKSTRGRKRNMYQMAETSYPPTKVARTNSHPQPAAYARQCSCPPFECLCQQARLSPCALSEPSMRPASGHPTFGPASAQEAARAYVDLHELTLTTPQWRETYGEYFDFSADAMNRTHHLHSTNPQLPSGYDTSIHMNNSKMCPAFSPSLFLKSPTFAKQEVSASCMYMADYGSRGSGSQYPSPVSSSSHDILNASRESSESQRSAAPSPSVVPCAYTHLPHGVDPANPFLEDFEINNAADILSLDSPIHKPGQVIGARHKKFPEVNPASILSDARLTSSVDLSAILPSITSFLGEDNSPENLEKESWSSPTHPRESLPSSGSSCGSPHAPSSLSPCRGTSPHCLTELKTVHTPPSHRQPLLQAALSGPHEDTKADLVSQACAATFDQSMLAKPQNSCSDFFESFSFYNGDICSMPDAPASQNYHQYQHHQFPVPSRNQMLAM